MATRKNNPPANRLAEIVAYRRSQGGSITGSIAGGLRERLKEKFDPRQLINQRGLMTALFPGLKTYQAKTAASEISNSSMQAASFDEIKPILETISYNTKMTAKNTMVLPALHRDINVVRQNMVKLVKLKGGDARTKADMYFVNAKDREEKYERELKKNRNNQSKLQKLKDDRDQKKGKGFLGFLGKLFSAIINGFKSIVGAILDLGKAIFGAFKLLAEIVIDVIGKVIGLILAPLKLLGGILKDFFVDFFKTSFMRIIASAIIRSAIGGMFSLLFSRKALVRLAGFLIGVFATTFGLEYFAKKYRESNFAETPLNPEDDADTMMDSVKRFKENQKIADKRKSYLPYDFTDSEFQDFKNSGVITKNATREGMGMSKPVRAQSREFDESFFNQTEDPLMGTVEPKFNKEAYKLYGGGKKGVGIFDVPIPGWAEPLSLLLNNDEAKDFGKKIKTYEILMERLGEELKQKNPNADLVKSILSSVNAIKYDISEKSLKLFNEQYNKDYKEYKLLKTGLELAKIGSKTFFEQIIDDASTTALDAFLNSDTYSNIQKEASPVLEKQFENLKDKLKFNEMRQQGLELFDEARKKTTKTIEDFTAANKNLVSETRSKVVEVYSNTTNKQDTAPSIEEPAPAWNQDYFENLGDTSIIGIK